MPHRIKRKCKNPKCSSEIGKESRTDKVYCSPFCQSEHYLCERNRVQNPDLDRGVKGAVGELVVCADLLTKGYEVFRSVSPTASCDLMIASRNSSRVFRIEVRTGFKTFKDKIITTRKGVYDFLAVVTQNGIVYEPEMLVNKGDMGEQTVGIGHSIPS